ncbi:hypothetical protein BDV93DRAFT_295444 [Ceratobasidium sp. AG-I]|nr:hypothetical protein BDV93DRAFT_295444 [Ceratobasidium sp. AG-I]
MSTSAEPEVRDVAESKQEALRALLNSLAPNGEMTVPKDADIEKLAEKLDELLISKGGLLGAQSNILRDDQGRPLNEEGLPIMEIVEPVSNGPPGNSLPLSSFASSSIPASEQAPLSPLPNWALSSEALAARRRERDRILDLLEQEEADELAREEAKVAAPQNKPPSGPVAKTPRTLDQIMRPPTSVLKPPIPALADSNVSEPPGSITVSAADTNGADRPSAVEAPVLGAGTSRKPEKQKSVSFVDPPPDNSNDRSNSTDPELDWGDVIPVPLSSRTPGPTKTQGIMKDVVVERLPVAPGVVPDRMGDSDDEDEETAEVMDDMPEKEDSETEVPVESLRASGGSDESDEEDGDRPTDDLDETDFDEAMLQREIALAYYARRNQIGPDVTSGPLFDSTSTHGASNDYEDADGTDVHQEQ